MDNLGDDLRALVDRDKIRQCLERLARGEDRRDAAMITASLWLDSVTDYGVFKGSFDEYLAWVVPGADAITNTQHVLGQTYVELDGDRARAETHVVSYHRIDIYGFHGLEGLQAIVERRAGGETGVAAVQTLVGDEVWKAAERAGLIVPGPDGKMALDDHFEIKPCEPDPDELPIDPDSDFIFT